MFCIYLRINSNLCHLQHKLIGFYNRDEKCLQRGADWVFKCFVFIWEQTATCATYSISWLVFITEMKSANSAVRTGPLNIAVWLRDSLNIFKIQQLYALSTLYLCVLYLSENKQRLLPPHNTNWLVFITEMKSVYSAVRTGSLNGAACACATYSVNWLVFITEIKSVYSAVRTGSLNGAVCASSCKG
jgi:hypothetical protein